MQRAWLIVGIVLGAVGAFVYDFVMTVKDYESGKFHE
jgi:hypothetical protein